MEGFYYRFYEHFPATRNDPLDIDEFLRELAQPTE